MRAQAPTPAATSRDAVLFFGLAFVLMWSCFFLVALVPIPAKSALGEGLILAGAFAPAIAALTVVALREGRPAAAVLLRGLTRWDVPGEYYGFALLFAIVVKLSAAIICKAASGSWPRFGDSLYLIPFAILFSTPFQIGEELGWRAYALPRMAQRLGLPGASLVLGAIWGFWHLPQFFITDGESYHQSFPVFVLSTIALSVVFAWLYARTKGSLLPVMLLHAAINNSKDIVAAHVAPETKNFSFNAPLLSWVTLALVWVSAAYFLRDMRKLHLDPGRYASRSIDGLSDSVQGNASPQP
jgi:uncharacterized protein